MSSPSINAPVPMVFSHTSVALICTFIICFSFFLYLGSRLPRISRPAQSSSFTTRRPAKRRRPKIWEVSLDPDPPCECGATCDWRPVAAWIDDRPYEHHPRQSSLRPMSHHVATITQAWFGTFHSECPSAIPFPAPPAPALPAAPEPRKLNVAVLVAMPSLRKYTQLVTSGLAYDEGQLSIGITSLPCEEQAMRKASRDRERT